MHNTFKKYVHLKKFAENIPTYFASLHRYHVDCNYCMKCGKIDKYIELNYKFDKNGSVLFYLLRKFCTSLISNGHKTRNYLYVN